MRSKESRSPESAMGDVERDAISHEIVVQALANFTDVFAQLKPYQQKELTRLILHKAIHAFRHSRGSPGRISFGKASG
jgi:hypothetical protein